MKYLWPTFVCVYILGCANLFEYIVTNHWSKTVALIYPLLFILPVVSIFFIRHIVGVIYKAEREPRN